MSLLIKNGTVLTHRGHFNANILLWNGKIAVFTKNEPKADEVIDASGKLVMPGVVDPHVHFRQPGMSSEDWASGSKAALAGGVTTVLDMPNTKPPTTTLSRLEEKKTLISTSTPNGPLVNYGLHFGVTVENLEEVFRAVGWGTPTILAASAKVFMGSSTGDLLVRDLEVIRQVVRGSRLVSVHAEDEEIILMHADKPDHSSRRPKLAAISAIKKLLSVAQQGRVYVLHVTSWDEAELASPFYREATPHHLFLNSSALKEIGNYAKVNPPLREESDRRSLWQALKNNMIEAIGSDHAPHLKEDKAKENAPSGMPGVETSLPLMINASLNGLIGLEKVVELMCYNPSRIFSIKDKGKMELGADADITIVDPNLEKKVTAEELHYKCGWTPYEGVRLRGWPIITIVGGKIAFREGEFFPVRGKEVSYAV
ncbi:MAG: dihydroorotase [Candidatus Verstraetearchaeota archaeon]|nr:dihydroorotase [Candidatus Verstraetearchaeota archaeon]